MLKNLDSVSLCSLGWPGTHEVDEGGREFTEGSSSASPAKESTTAVDVALKYFFFFK